MSSGSDSEPEVEGKEVDFNDLTNSDIVTKYRLAAEIATKTMEGVLSQLVAGKTVLEVCKFGDDLIVLQTAKYFKSKKVEKGVAFPTCVSVNDVVCHNSPLESEEPVVLKAGDTVRVDLGVHMDGYIAQVAQTVVVKGEGDAAAVTGPLADAVVGAHTALEAAIRTVKPGAKNTDVTAVISKVAEAFGLNAVQGTLSHEIKRYVIDGSNVILQKEDTDNKADEFEFTVGDAFTLDVCLSSGEGKPKETGARTTVFKRAVDETYRLKMKSSRYVLNEVSKRFPTLPFTIRVLEDEKQARMGVVECVKHDLLHPYPVLCEKPEAHVGHFKATVLILPSGTVKITGASLPEGAFASDKTVPEDLAALLATGTGKKRRKKKKKGGAGGGAGGAEA